MENEIFKSLFQIVDFFNDPKHDIDLLRKAGIKGDQNLLSLVVRVGVAKVINIGDLAKQVGKTHSSISRQVDKFEKQGLLKTTYNKTDKRIREIALTEEGMNLFNLITKARLDVFNKILSEVQPNDVNKINEGLSLLADILQRIEDESL